MILFGGGGEFSCRAVLFSGGAEGVFREAVLLLGGDCLYGDGTLFDVKGIFEGGGVIVRCLFVCFSKCSSESIYKLIIFRNVIFQYSSVQLRLV